MWVWIGLGLLAYALIGYIMSVITERSLEPYYDKVDEDTARGMSTTGKVLSFFWPLYILLLLGAALRSDKIGS